MPDSQMNLIGPAASDFLSSPLKMLVDGAWVDAQSGERLDVRDPATAQVIASAPKATAGDVDTAVKAARRAFEGGWSTERPATRERLLLKLADLLERDVEEFADLETLNGGKLRMMARYGDLMIAIESIRYMAGWATKLTGTTLNPSFSYVPDLRFTSNVYREPLGVVGQIIPWNFPLVMAVWKIAPALAAGCTVVLKPAEDTPITALRLGKLIEEAGFPPGVVNIVTGDGEVGAAIVDHPDIDKIAFTGSTSTGQIIQQRAAATMKRLSLELGGKSPVIVFDDADVGAAVQGAANAVFFNNGQVCTAGSRLFVQRKAYDAVLDGLAELVENFKVGSGFDPDSQMGPLVSAVQKKRVEGYLNKGVDQGARLVAGGKSDDRDGYFFRPTVFADVTDDMAVYREEIFGPILSACVFDDVDEVVRRANDTPYGLGASVWTNNLVLANRVVPKIRAGNVWINCHNLLDPSVPFGGYKMSGYGRELGAGAVELYTETKSVTTALL